MVAPIQPFIIHRKIVGRYSLSFLNIVRQNRKTIFVVVQLLRHEYEWIQSSSTRILGQYLKMRGDDYSLNSEDLAFQHDGVDLELAVNNSMLLFENNFKCSEISIEMEVLRQSARNITSISLLFLSKNVYLTQKSTEFRAKKGITCYTKSW